MEQPKALGFLGGAFDPIHKGHLNLAKEVRKIFALDKIYLIPNANPPHKNGSFCSYENRLQMTELALGSLNHRQYQVSLLEQEQERRHYTYDTLQELRRKYGEDARLFFIMGMDSLMALDTWHRGLELTDFANLAVLGRPHYQLQAAAQGSLQLQSFLHSHLVFEHDPDFAKLKMLPCGKVFVLNHREYDVSSTSLRAALLALNLKPDDPTAAAQVHSMLSAPVLHYIRTHQLYRAEE